MFSKDILDSLLRFRSERDWEQFHTPKNLAISISIEAAELLEKFQWSLDNDKSATDSELEEIRDELADIAIYLTYLSTDLGIDLSQAVIDKLQKNITKYPLSKARGRSTKYTKL